MMNAAVWLKRRSPWHLAPRWGMSNFCYDGDLSGMLRCNVISRTVQVGAATSLGQVFQPG